MKKQLIAILLLFSAVSASGATRIQFRLSRPFGILNFMRAASNDAHLSQTLVTYVHDHIPAADSALFYKAIRSFAAIELDNSYNFPEYPLARQKPRSLAGIINNAAIQSVSIDDFLSRIVGILPNEQWMKLKKAMIIAAPFYDEMMQPFDNAMRKQLHALEKYNTKTDDIFYRLKTFYGSTWSDDMPFTVSLFAIPGFKGNTTASPYSNSLALGVLTEERNHETRMGVAIHEICHVLYEEQPLKLQWKTDSVFMQSKSAYARYAYGYFDEALATACGNGWAYAQLAGSTDTGDWYDDTYINRFAKGIYADVKVYIDAGKKIDSSFVSRAINKFEQTFPDAIYEYANLLNSVNLYTDAAAHNDFNEVYSSLARYIRITSSNGSYPIADPQTQQQIDNADGTQLFIVYTAHEANYALLKKKFPQIKSLDPGKEGIASFYDNKKRPVVILNVKNIGRVALAARQLQKDRLMSPTQLFKPLQ